MFFDERAGISEFDGGLPRPAAEVRAFAGCVAEWMNRHPQTSSPERCLACGGGDSVDDPLLPFGRTPWQCRVAFPLLGGLVRIQEGTGRLGPCRHGNRKTGCTCPMRNWGS